MSAPWLLILRALVSLANSIVTIFQQSRKKQEDAASFEQMQKARDLDILLTALKARRSAQKSAKKAVTRKADTSFEKQTTAKSSSINTDFLPAKRMHAQKDKYQRD
ncbi:MAG: hypothetical protein AB8B49_02335 [Nitratireductor sp.]